MRKAGGRLALLVAIIAMTLPTILALFFYPARWANWTLIAAGDLLMEFEERLG